MIKNTISKKREFWYSLQNYYNEQFKIDLLKLEAQNDFKYAMYILILFLVKMIQIQQYFIIIIKHY